MFSYPPKEINKKVVGVNPKKKSSLRNVQDKYFWTSTPTTFDISVNI